MSGAIQPSRSIDLLRPVLAASERIGTLRQARIQQAYELEMLTGKNPGCAKGFVQRGRVDCHYCLVPGNSRR